MAAAILLFAAPVEAARLPLGSGHTLVVEEASGRLKLVDRWGKTVWRTDAGWLAASTGRAESFHLFGTFRFREPEAGWTAIAGPADSLVAGDTLSVVWPRMQLTARRVGTSGVQLTVRPEAGFTRLSTRFVLDPDEAVYGLGARTYGANPRGRHLTNWVEEGGNGKSDRPLFGVSNYPTASHVPIPFLLNSAGYGLSVDTDRRVRWDVGASHPHRLTVTAEAPELSFTLWAGDTPGKILAAYTAHTGRPSLPPWWAMAPSEWGKGGSAAVRAKARFLREQKVPAGAIWYEDWVGLEHGPLPNLTHLPWGRWIVDPAHYPEVGRLNAELEAQGFKSLGYFNPFVPQGGLHTPELLAMDGVAKDAAGQPLWWWGPYGALSHLDLTNPRVRTWAEGHLAEFERLGFDGAMVDFGEWTPVEAHFQNGQTGEAAHNRYPGWWARLHQGFWQRVRPNDHVIYTRAGHTGAAAHSTYMWAGDQNTDWGTDDGLPTALSAILSAGLSGVPLMTHDLGGFANLNGPGRSKELYFRWTSFAAMSTFMRSHSGQKPALNWHMDSDAETLAHHRRWAETHMDLALYRHAACREAAESGMPVMRHLYLAFPGDRGSRGIEDQYMLGRDLLVAPVLAPGASRREVYLPPGRWFGWADDRPYLPGRQTVAAGVTELPVFVRAGAVLPLLPAGVQTLSTPEAPAPMRVRAYAGPATTFQLADGTRLENRPGAVSGPLTARADGRPVAVEQVGDRRVVQAGRATAVTLTDGHATWTVRRSGGTGTWEVAFIGGSRSPDPGPR